jgi:hypothetical protein
VFSDRVFSVFFFEYLVDDIGFDAGVSVSEMYIALAGRLMLPASFLFLPVAILSEFN